MVRKHRAVRARLQTWQYIFRAARLHRPAQRRPTETAERCGKEILEKLTACIDEGNQDLVEYKPQIGWQPNPFDNDIPTEIDDRPVEDYVGEGEGRPGEGKPF